MLKRLLTLIVSFMCLLTMNAQQEILWEDPVGQYQTETVVYAAVVANNNPTSGIFNPASLNEGDCQIGAFVNGTLRAVVDMYNYTTIAMPTELQEKVQIAEYSEDGSPLIAVYTFRVGGDVDADADAKIEFRVLSGGAVYKAHTYLQGVIGSLGTIEINRRELANAGSDELVTGEFTGLNWKGDATINNPTNFYCINFAPAMMVTSTPETLALEMRIGDPAINLKEQFESFKFSSGDGTEVAAPLEGGFWEYNNQYLSFEGDNVTAIVKPETEDPIIATYRHGMFINSEGCTAEITILDPWVFVENIMVEDVTIFKGQTPFSPEVIFNNGESDPTEMGYRLVSNNPDIVTIVNGALEPVGIGEATVTVTSVGTNSDGNAVSYTFAVNVRSAIENYGFWVGDEFVNRKLVEVWHETEDFDLGNFLGAPEYIVSEELTGDIMVNLYDFTMESSDSEVVSIVTDEYGGQNAYAIKKGVATITFTNKYDPSKTATAVVTVKQVPSSIEFISYSINGGDEKLFANLTSNALEAGIDQPITIKARISPEDADFDEGSFIMELMRAEGIGEIVTPPTVEGNECTITVKGIAIGLFSLNAEAQYTRDEDPMTISSNIFIEITQSVTDIEVADETTVWINNRYDSFEFPITVLPETASNKELTFTYEPLNDGDEFEVSPIEIIVGDIGYTLVVNKKANVKVTATSVDNPTVSKSFNIYAKQRVQRIVFGTDDQAPEINMYNDGQEYNVYARIIPADADFIEDEFSLVAEYSSDNFGGENGWDAFDYSLLDVVQTTVSDEAEGEYYYNYRISGKALCPEGFFLSANYNGATQGQSVEEIDGIEVKVNEKVEIPTGWSWISLTSGTHTTNINGLVEARSQHELVYNDPVYGFFGDFTTMYPLYDAYKLDVSESFVMYPTYEDDFASFVLGDSPSINLNTGWNWVGYPYEYSYMVSEVFDVSQFSEGDLILSKNSGLAALKNGEWENDFVLEPNTGYMVYHNGDETSADMPGRFDMQQGTFRQERSITTKALRKESVWSFDASRFANTMAIIGKLDLNDAAEDYTIGAFVGDECRGEGKVVNGTAYITAAGESGEEVSFRLYNKWTGKYSDIVTTLTFADLAGSVMNPVILKAPNTTGINDVATGNQSIYLNGNTLILGNYNGVATIMTTDGKVAATTTEASIAVDELPAGVYVVIINSENGRIVKKIAKN